MTCLTLKNSMERTILIFLNPNSGKSGLQLSQFNDKFEPGNANVFNQSAVRNVGIKTKLNLREVIILDSQSTMDISCN